MLIIDYIRHVRRSTERQKDGRWAYITIPPFHTGMLGFTPGTRVYSNLTISTRSPLEGSNDGCHACELLVSPFTEPIGQMFHFEVMLRDQRGVVKRVMRAIHAMGLNVVKLESTIINADQHHFMQCILDWGTTEKVDHKKRASLPSDRHLFGSLHERIPIEDERYIDLYEHIMRRCGDVIVIDNAYGKRMPSILMRPFCNRRFEAGESSTIERVAPSERPPGGALSGVFNVCMYIDDDTLQRVHEATGTPEGESLPYLLVSYGLHRTLRVLFPKWKAAAQTARIAFVHRDNPGAILRFTKLLDKAGLNIWDSLNRKMAENVAIFEVLATYVGEGSQMELPLKATSKLGRRDRELEMLGKIVERFAEVINRGKRASTRRRRLEHLNRYALRIGTPAYPLHLNADNYYTLEWDQGAERVVSRSHDGRGSPKRDLVPVGPSLRRIDRGKRHSRPRRAIERARAKGDLPRKLIAEAVSVRKRTPRIFLSYPRIAREHAVRLTRRLEKRFRCRVIEYQNPDFRDVTRKATDLIVSSDYFVGLWHHESREGAREYSVSPWMPFEYGVATAQFLQQRPGLAEITANAILIYSSSLPKSITQRIQTGIAQPSYSDLEFSRTLKLIVTHCHDVWRLQDRQRKRTRR